MPLSDDLPADREHFMIVQCVECGRNRFYLASAWEQLAPDCPDCSADHVVLASCYVNVRARERRRINLYADRTTTLRSVVEGLGWR